MTSLKSDGPLVVSRGRSAALAATVPVATLLAWGNTELQRAGVPPIESRWLLEWALGVESLVHAPARAGIRAAEKYRSGIAQRRSGIPFQHVTGEMSFRYLTLKAGPGVFSVRPETETLVDLALAARPAGPARVADLCAGSGAIGLAIATERPQTRVVAVEVDEVALRYLQANYRRVRPRLTSSTFEIRDEDATACLPGSEGEFDLVVSNPPYVGALDAPVQPEAKLDPPRALYGGGEDGLVTPRGVVTRAFELLDSGGTLLMEHGERQGRSLREHADSVGFVNCATLTDLAGRPRYLQALKP